MATATADMLTTPEIRHIPTAYKQKLAARRQQALEWYKQGYLLREIAAAYGVSESIICRDLQRMRQQEQTQNRGA